MSTPTPIHAVVFDRDGVLTEFDLAAGEHFFGPRVPLSLWEIFARWEAQGNATGFPNSVEAEQRFFTQFWDALCDDFHLSEAVRRDLHAFDYTTCLRVFDDVRPALQQARASGLRIGVLSNFALASLEKSLRGTGLAPWIDVACAATVIGVAKPAPQAYTIVAARLGVQPEQCLFFDDEPVCVEGAARVGMHAYLVDRSRRSHDLARHVVADLSAIAELMPVHE